ncbi:MAG: hypothetical protein EOS34_27225 [Mesorhizobium sp.]|nr:MAG: hypothetical protein EOS34_27225 [Mesorhizobium sp.]
MTASSSPPARGMPISAMATGRSWRPCLKTIGDTTEIRAHILAAFEKTEINEDPTSRARLLTFVIVGGGPTGVELAGAIGELARKAIVSDFRRIDSSTARGCVGRSRNAYATGISGKSVGVGKEAAGKTRRRGAARPGRDACDENGVVLADGRAIASACVLWAAGVQASRAAKWLKAEADRASRVIVCEDLSLPAHPEVFVIGDTAFVVGEDGKPVPGIAPAAKQIGKHVAKLIKGRLAGRSIGPFRYTDHGNLATIGRKAAVADFGWIRLSGFIAWLLWSFPHLRFLVGFRNRIVVFLDWTWAYATTAAHASSPNDEALKSSIPRIELWRRNSAAPTGRSSCTSPGRVVSALG